MRGVVDDPRLLDLAGTSPIRVRSEDPTRATSAISSSALKSSSEPVSSPGSYALFRAEMELVIAFSACPQDILPINGTTGRTTEAHFAIE